MAVVSLKIKIPALLSSSSSSKRRRILSFSPLRSKPPSASTLLCPKRRLHRALTAVKAVEEGQEDGGKPEVLTEKEVPKNQPVELSELAEELKKAMKERKEKEGGEADLWGGVAEEIREIEWPAFGKVLGTTGVVLGIIAGSSVVLLTVNAVLAELSDAVFAGKGVQDFFS